MSSPEAQTSDGIPQLSDHPFISANMLAAGLFHASEAAQDFVSLERGVDLTTLPQLGLGTAAVATGVLL